MSLLAKIFTLFRGAARETGQAVVDANAIRILEQELVDAGNELARSKQELTKVMAQRQLAANRGQGLLAKRREYEGYIQGALRKGDEALAREIAAKLAEIESSVAAEGTTVSSLDASIQTLKAAIKATEQQLARLKQQIDTVKATEAVQRAQAAVASRHAGANGKLGTALDSLERIKQRQEERGARLQAANELANESGDGDLKAKLAQAGLIEDHASTDAVLARYREAALAGPAAPVAALGHAPSTLDAVAQDPFAPLSQPVEAPPQARG